MNNLVTKNILLKFKYKKLYLVIVQMSYTHHYTLYLRIFEVKEGKLGK